MKNLRTVLVVIVFLFMLVVNIHNSSSALNLEIDWSWFMETERTIWVLIVNILYLISTWAFFTLGLWKINELFFGYGSVGKE